MKKHEAVLVWHELRRESAIFLNSDSPDWHYCFGYLCCLLGENPHFNTITVEKDKQAAQMGYFDAQGDYPD